MGVAPKGRWRVVPVKDGLHPRRGWGGLRTRPRPGEEAPRVGWGPDGLCPWGGAPEGNTTIRQAWPAIRRRKPMALPVQETMPFPRVSETWPKPPAFQSRNVGFGARRPPAGRLDRASGSGYHLLPRRSGGIGRRAGFRVQCSHGRGGSSPPFGTKEAKREAPPPSWRFAPSGRFAELLGERLALQPK